MSLKTTAQYEAAFDACRDIFLKKTKDYGTSWRILRPSSLTDQLFIKAQRIRTLEEGAVQQVEEGVGEEFMAIVNYVVIALIQLELGKGETEVSGKQASTYYDRHKTEIQALMLAKNNDYGEAWRDMRISSFTDMILMKLLRVKQIEENDGATLISEGVDGHYRDMANYALFALIKLKEAEQAGKVA